MQPSDARPPGPSRWRTSTLVGAVVIVVAAITFVADAGPRLTAPFGDSLDGVNGAMWASGARSIDEQGLVASRFGADAPERGVYAHHPPGILLVTALSRSAAGDSETALRAPAFVGSLAAIVLLWLLLRRCGLGIGACAVGVAAMAGSDLFRVFGAMANFEAISLPIALAAILLVVRARDGKRDPAALAFALGLVGALCSWEFVLLGGAIVTLDVWERHRLIERPATTRWLGIGTAAGLVTTLGWLLWSNGGPAELLKVLQERSGDDGANIAEYADRQFLYLQAGFPLWALILAAAGGALVLARPRRAESLVVLGVPVVYALAFRQGSYIHEYWNYWLLVPVAMFAAIAVDRVLPGGSWRQGSMVGVALVLLLLGPALGQSVQPQRFADGAAGGALVATHLRDRGAVAVWPAVGEPAWWIDYYSRAQHETLDDSSLHALASAEPTRLVLVSRIAVEHHFSGALFDRIAALAEQRDGGYLLVEAANLVSVTDDVSVARQR